MPQFLPSDAAAWTRGVWSAPAQPARRILHDSRHVEPGDWYLALRGEHADGHAFLRDAFARGACGAIVERGRAAHGPCLEVEHSPTALTQLARGHRARLKGRILAVTGSVGKSTVKEMIASILSRTARVCRNPGNWNNDLGVPLSLLAMEPEDDWGVFEIGMNHPGELGPLCELLRPEWGVMTRVGPVHIEFFENENAIAEEKAALLRALPPGGLAFVAADEPWFDQWPVHCRARMVQTALDAAVEADITGRWNAATGELTVFVRGGVNFVCRLPLPGEPMARNALRAAAVGMEAGVSPVEIAAGLATFQLPPMRWEETVRTGIRWINDAYNASSISMIAAARTFAESVPASRRWLVLGGMRELGAHSAELHREVGRAVATVSTWAGVLCVGPAAAGIAEGAEEAGMDRGLLRRCADAEAAAQVLHCEARDGDAVLLKGSRGERVERVFEEWERLCRGADGTGSRTSHVVLPE